MRYATDDIRIDGLRPLLPPAVLLEEVALDEKGAELVTRARTEAGAIVRGEDPRLLVVVGPCSIHDPKAALEYGARLRALSGELSDALLLVMRVYFEKPRTTVGWKGLINDPDLDGSFAINKGLRLARGLLRDLASMGVPSGTEMLDTITPQFLADVVAWGAIGARTTESQVHRELASGMSMPVGFKNGTDGNVQIAIDAARAARDPHHFLGVTKQGISAIVKTRGNDTAHVILRGGNTGPNYGPEHVTAVARRLDDVGLPPRLMIDLSHGNSGKRHDRQCEGAASVAAQLRGGSRAVLGVMIESHLVAGRQDVVAGTPLVYGQSITDACLAWDDTVPLLRSLADAVRASRPAEAR
jgi:3-deoxy-7-phosphoheptulonate synthase